MIFLGILVHFLEKDLSIFKNSLSRYMMGEYGFVLLIAFIFGVFANFLSAILLACYDTSKMKLCSLLFLLSAVSLLLVALSRGNGDGIIQGFTEYVHFISTLFLMFISTVIIFIIGGSFKKKYLRIYSYFKFYMALIFTVTAFIFIPLNSQSGIIENSLMGFFERIFILLILMWFLVFIANYNKIYPEFSKEKIR
ncbi:MAG: DUF998 domain-containing protein [Nanoarchaeota archaeon]